MENTELTEALLERLGVRVFAYCAAASGDTTLARRAYQAWVEALSPALERAGAADIATALVPALTVAHVGLVDARATRTADLVTRFDTAANTLRNRLSGALALEPYLLSTIFELSIEQISAILRTSQKRVADALDEAEAIVAEQPIAAQELLNPERASQHTALRERRTLQIGDSVHGTWRVAMVLHGGGAAAAYLVKNEDGEAAFLKVLFEPSSIEADLVAARRFRHEIDAQRKLCAAGIQAVPKLLDAGVLDVGRCRGQRFLMMQYLSRPVLDVKRTWLLGEVCQMVVPLLTALRQCHAAGVVHGDIQPLNILYDGALVNIVDFGLARVATDTKTEMNDLAGTGDYAAPETRAPGARRTWPGFERDTYAVCALIHKLVLGSTPASRGGLAVEFDAGVPSPLREVLSRGLEPDVTKRFTSAKELEVALLGVADYQRAWTDALEAAIRARDWRRTRAMLSGLEPTRETCALPILASRRVAPVLQELPNDVGAPLLALMLAERGRHLDILVRHVLASRRAHVAGLIVLAWACAASGRSRPALELLGVRNPLALRDAWCSVALLASRGLPTEPEPPVQTVLEPGQRQVEAQNAPREANEQTKASDAVDLGVNERPRQSADRAFMAVFFVWLALGVTTGAAVLLTAGVERERFGGMALGSMSVFTGILVVALLRTGLTRRMAESVRLVVSARRRA
ncbi:MAG: hypothetical protein U0414_44305 [Polyangiaceae bacterium]